MIEIRKMSNCSECTLHTYQQITRELNHAPLSVNYTRRLCPNPVPLNADTYILRKFFLERQVKEDIRKVYLCADKIKCAV